MPEHHTLQSLAPTFGSTSGVLDCKADMVDIGRTTRALVSSGERTSMVVSRCRRDSSGADAPSGRTASTDGAVLPVYGGGEEGVTVQGGVIRVL